MNSKILASVVAVSVSLFGSIAYAEVGEVHASGQPQSAVLQRDLIQRTQNPPQRIAGDRYCVVPPAMGVAYRVTHAGSPTPSLAGNPGGMAPRGSR